MIAPLKSLAMPGPLRARPDPGKVFTFLCVAVFALALFPSLSHANPLDEFGLGPRGMSMGSANTALADDVSANYYNPAGLASREELRLEIGYQYVQPLLEINDADLNVDRSSGIVAGAVIPGELFERTIAFSIGLFLPDDRISRIRALPQQQPRFVLYDNRPQRIVITSSLALEIIEDLYIGAGLTYIANTKGTLAMTGDVSITDASETRLLTGVDVALESVRYVSAGVLWTPGNWRLGAVFRDEFFSDIALNVNVDATLLLAGNPLDQGSLNVLATDANLFSPRQVYLGVAHVADDWTIELDFGWLQWSRFPAPTARIAIDIDLESLDFSIPAPDEPIDPNFRDIFVPRLGVEGTVLDDTVFGMVLRGGYFFQPSPARDQRGRTNYVDSDRHGFGFGTTLRFANFSAVFPEPIYFDLGGLLIALQERSYEKDNPADPIGDYSADGLILGISTMLRLHF